MSLALQHPGCILIAAPAVIWVAFLIGFYFSGLDGPRFWLAVWLTMAVFLGALALLTVAPFAFGLDAWAAATRGSHATSSGNLLQVAIDELQGRKTAKQEVITGYVASRTPVRAPVSGRECAAYRLLGEVDGRQLDDTVSGRFDVVSGDRRWRLDELPIHFIGLEEARGLVKLDHRLLPILPRGEVAVEVGEATLQDGDLVEVTMAIDGIRTEADGYRDGSISVPSGIALALLRVLNRVSP